jgi:signal transduction histidine kinase
MVFHNWSISKKILLGMLPLFLLFVVVSVALNNRYQEQEMMEQAQVAAHTYADIIKEALVNMMVTNYEVDESFLERVSVLQQFDSLHILINDLRLREEILAEKRLKPLASRHKTTMPHDDPMREVLRSGLPTFTRTGDHFRGIVPFSATKVCQKCHAVPVGYTLGAADIHISLSRIAEATEENWKRSFIIFLGFSIAVVFFASMLFSRFVSRPVDKLVKATAEISAGNLDHAAREELPLQEASRDELAFLSVKLDAMRESLRDKIEQLDEVNKNLAERNAEVEQALTRLKQAQEELVRSERLAATGKMTAQLSHEINNPIHNIQSLLESSLNKIDGQPKELVALALEEVTRMEKLTRKMLEFYRGTLVDVEKKPVDLHELIEHLLKENEQALLESKIHTVFDMSATTPVVSGSRDKLKQVFLNLILNARDSIPDGGELRLKTRLTNGLVRIEVSDTGVGIPPEHLGKIFDAFFTTKKEVSGIGLGLSVTYGIVQQHNGKISVASQVGAGTTFTIELPSAHS